MEAGGQRIRGTGTVEEDWGDVEEEGQGGLDEEDQEEEPVVSCNLET